jgi:hypothetical protein
MNRKIFILTTDGGSREDGNVYYSRCVLIEHPTLKFSEPIFSDDSIFESEESADQQEAWILEVLSLGYTVHADIPQGVKVVSSEY